MNRDNTQKGIKTRICMISDTHTCRPNPPTDTSNPYRHPLPKADVLLHAGDITKVGHKIEHEAMVAMLKEAEAELKIVIAGNHDITLDAEYYARMGRTRHRTGPLEDPAEIRELWVGEDARKAGIVYMDEGVRTFTLSNGAQFTLYASPYQPEFCQWAFAYERRVDRFNPSPPVSPFQAPNPVPSYPDVDILLTHGPPYGILDQVYYSNQSVGCENLLKACKRARPRLHVFGHIHEGYGAVRQDWTNNTSERILQDPETVLENRSCYYNASSDGKRPLRYGEETLFVNASVVTVNYVPTNAPWVVDIDLPPATATTKAAEVDSVTLS
ncbi:hypothetical protein VTN96DRAFT_1054 [Rasamsonia emersonii]